MTAKTETSGAPSPQNFPRYDVAVMGRGNSAALAALALADSGFSVWAEAAQASPDKPTNPKQPANDQHTPTWQRVLALSPGARRGLETLGVWQRLEAGHAPVADIAVGGPNDRDLPLRFAASSSHTVDDPPVNDPPVDIVSHIVSVTDLTAAIAASLQACPALTDQAPASETTSAPTDFDARTGILTLADGAQIRAALLVDATGAQSVWRQRAGISCLHHDYDCGALTAEIALGTPHGQVARQVFLPDGPLALLPLPKPDRAALVWSLPARKAQALAACDESVFNGELNAAAREPFGQMHLISPRAHQPLKAQIAEAFIGPRLVLVGEAAHVIHPLAGQGMNLTLRDIGALVDTLTETRRLGLDYGDATMLENYARLRRADALAGAFGTHALAEIFSGPPPARALAAAGMRGVGFIAHTYPKLKDAFRRQADQGLGPLSGLFTASPLDDMPPPDAADTKKQR
jgi:ubiquinone biosynthesis UbiH/UbiF/VisC/COQ6 family hydroxylase